MIRREPHRRVTHTDVGRLTRYEESMRSDNAAGWEARCAPVIDFLLTGPKTRREIFCWASHKGGNAMGRTIAEECLYWLLAQERVKRVDDKWAVADCLCARTAPGVNFGCALHGSAVKHG